MSGGDSLNRVSLVARKMSFFTRMDLERLYAVVGRSGVLRRSRREEGESPTGAGYRGRGGTATAPFIEESE